MNNFSFIIRIRLISYIRSFLEIEYLSLIWVGWFLILIIRKKTHFRIFLICIELISITILIIIIYTLIKIFVFAPLFFLVICFRVGEACIGLSITIFLSRFIIKEILIENIT
jgi:hypothetical protein